MSVYNSESDDEFAENSVAGSDSRSIIHEYTPSDTEDDGKDGDKAPGPRIDEDVVITERAYARDGSETDDPLDSPTALEHTQGVMVNQYVLKEALGKGKHGVVRACHVESEPHETLAMKIVMRDPPEAKTARKYNKLRASRLPRSNNAPVVDQIHTVESKIKKEIAIMKKCRHPHVVRLFEVIDDRQLNSIYMIMEYLGGGEIQWREKISSDPLTYRPLLQVDQSRRILRDAMLGLEYLHFQGIIHRDIKPANLVWSRNRAHVKIADFGVAHFSYAQRLAAAGDADATDEDPILLDDAELSKLAGSPAFVAPDVLLDFVEGYEAEAERAPLKVTKAIDIWALGVTLFGFFFGNLPFEGLAEYAIYKSIANDDWTPRSHMGYDQIPTGGRSPIQDGSEGAMAMYLLDQCLLKNASQRITLEAMKSSPWVLSGVPDSGQWLRATDPKPIVVTPQETDEALSIVRVRTTTPHLLRRFLGILIPTESTRRRKKSPPSSARDSSLTRAFSRGEKGKRKAGNDETSSAKRSLRLSSRQNSSATLSPQASPVTTKPTLFKDIVKHITPWKPTRSTSSMSTSGGYDGDADDESNIATPSHERPGFSFTSASTSSLKPTPLVSHPTEPIYRINPGDANTRQGNMKIPQRMSEEMLKASALTHARRTSSWGDHPMERLNAHDVEPADILVQPSSSVPVRRAPPSSKAARLDEFYAGMTFRHPSSDEDDDDEYEGSLKDYNGGSTRHDTSSNYSPAPQSEEDSDDDSDTGGALVFSTPGRKRHRPANTQSN